MKIPELKFPWKPIAIGSAVLGGIGAVVLATRRAKDTTSPKRVALIGDSYAVGLTPELKTLLTVPFQSEGHVGTGTSTWAHHTAACGQCGDWITAFKPDVVLVSLGVNDDPVNLANYQTIVRGLHGIGARVVWIEPPASVHTASIDSVRKAIASLGVTTVPATATPLAADGLHPQSYNSWAHEIAEVLNHA